MFMSIQQVWRVILRQIGYSPENFYLSWDLYTETGTANHYRITQDFFLTLYDIGMCLLFP